jgi:hypothetical protein
MSRSLGLLLSCFDYSPVREDEFHDWYDTEHIPERERVPGFLHCRRWIAVDRPKASVATYDLAGVDVLRSPEYLAIGYENNSPWTRRVGWNCIKLLRMEGEQIVPGDQLPPADAAALCVWAFNLDGADETALVDWYRSTQVPLVHTAGDILGARLFRATASTHRYAALYYLSSVDSVQRAAWRQHVEATWAERLEPHERDRFRLLARKYVRGQSCESAHPASTDNASRSQSPSS